MIPGIGFLLLGLILATYKKGFIIQTTNPPLILGYRYTKIIGYWFITTGVVWLAYYFSLNWNTNLFVFNVLSAFKDISLFLTLIILGYFVLFKKEKSQTDL